MSLKILSSSRSNVYSLFSLPVLLPITSICACRREVCVLLVPWVWLYLGPSSDRGRHNMNDLTELWWVSWKSVYRRTEELCPTPSSHPSTPSEEGSQHNVSSVHFPPHMQHEPLSTSVFNWCENLLPFSALMCTCGDHYIPTLQIMAIASFCRWSANLTICPD